MTPRGRFLKCHLKYGICLINKRVNATAETLPSAAKVSRRMRLREPSLESHPSFLPDIFGLKLVYSVNCVYNIHGKEYYKKVLGVTYGN